MKPNTSHRQLATGGVAASGEFGISHKDSAHIMQILRDQLYSDKVLAVLREYSSNAWDAHRETNQAERPIKVTLPTQEDPTLSIRDWGPGLSPEDVFEIYTQYGASTKRGSDDTIGMLGIGSKAGFAYSDTFTVISWHGGTKRTYVAVLDESDKGLINLMCEEPCGPETGVEIQLAVKLDDLDEFRRTAQRLFRYFTPPPDINIDLPVDNDEVVALPHGRVFNHGNTRWFALMGCIPYRIDLNQLRTKDFQVQRCVDHFGGLLYCDIGEVHISASREELKYSDLTRKAITTKLDAIVDELVQVKLKAIELAGTTWEKRWAYRRINQLSLPLPVAFDDYLEDTLKFDPPKTFIFTRGHKRKTIGTQFTVGQSTKFWYFDDPSRSILGYNIDRWDDIVIRKLKGHSWKEVEDEFAAFMEQHKITGAPLAKLSTQPWTQRVGVRGPQDHTKYKYRVFRLNYSRPKPNMYYKKAAPSTMWEAVTRTPTPDDVFTVLEGFRPLGWDPGGSYRTDRTLFELYGQPMPEVYGYRSTEKKPIDPATLIGTEYREWRVQVRERMAEQPGIRKYIQFLYWVNLFKKLGFYQWHYAKIRIQEVAEELGLGHLISRYLLKGLKIYNSLQHNKRTGPHRLHQVADSLLTFGVAVPNEAKQVNDYILNRYQLLKAHGDLFDTVLDEDKGPQWVQYVKLVDAAVRRQEMPDDDCPLLHPHP